MKWTCVILPQCTCKNSKQEEGSTCAFLHSFFSPPCWPGGSPAADIRPLDLSSGANSAFADETADDRRGGWTDQGANDLRLLKSGVQTLGGVPFSILDDGRSGGKSCIVLAAAENRNYLPKQARVELSEPLSGRKLYLLHAGAWLNPKKNLVGRLTVEYAGRRDERVPHPPPAATSPTGGATPGEKNAVRIWSVYNNNSQVSLYGSRFDLDEKPVKAVRFDAGKTRSGWSRPPRSAMRPP